MVVSPATTYREVWSTNPPKLSRGSSTSVVPSSTCIISSPILVPKPDVVETTILAILDGTPAESVTL